MRAANGNVRLTQRRREADKGNGKVTQSRKGAKNGGTEVVGGKVAEW